MTGPHDLDAFRAVVDLNTVATFNISRLAAMHMSRNTPEDDERGCHHQHRPRWRRTAASRVWSPTPPRRRLSRACA